MPAFRVLTLRTTSVAVVALSACVLRGTVVNAQESVGQSGCLLAPARFSSALTKTFIEHPTDILERHPLGGVTMSAEVKRLAASDVVTVASLIGVAKGGSPAQVVAIGAGLAQAWELCSRSRPDLQERIEQEVAAAGLPDLAATFAVYKLASSATAPVPYGEATKSGPIGTSEGPSVGAMDVAVAPSEVVEAVVAPPMGVPAGGQPPASDAESGGGGHMGPFATSESALPFFAGNGGVGGGVPPEGGSPSPLLQLGPFSFSPVALPFFVAGSSGTSREVVSPAR